MNLLALRSQSRKSALSARLEGSSALVAERKRIMLIQRDGHDCFLWLSEGHSGTC
jgi:hypothetical protein